MAPGIRNRESAGTVTFIGCQQNMQKTASQSHGCMSPLPQGKVLFMNVRVVYALQNNTLSGSNGNLWYGNHRNLFKLLPKSELTSNVKWDEHCKRIILRYFNMVFCSSGYIRFFFTPDWLLWSCGSYINANKIVIPYWFLEDHSILVYSSFQGGQARVSSRFINTSILNDPCLQKFLSENLW